MWVPVPAYFDFESPVMFWLFRLFTVFRPITTTHAYWLNGPLYESLPTILQKPSVVFMDAFEDILAENTEIHAEQNKNPEFSPSKDAHEHEDGIQFGMDSLSLDDKTPTKLPSSQEKHSDFYYFYQGKPLECAYALKFYEEIECA